MLCDPVLAAQNWRWDLSDWDCFFDEIAKADPRAAFTVSDRPCLAIDARLPHGMGGLTLEKKDGRNQVGRPTPSVLQLVKDMSFPVSDPALRELEGFPDLLKRVRIFATDASPDTVVSAVIFAARQSAVSVPDWFWTNWLSAITNWEQTGNAANPERSWPALASALAHRYFGSQDDGQGNLQAQLGEAWAAVLRFFAEAIRYKYNAEDIPEDAPGIELAVARAALAEERSRYRRRAIASDIHQISLPMKDAPRRRLVDALFTRESEFAGALKVLARNDKEGSPLGQGFALLLVERDVLRDTTPEYWMTISVDPSSGVYLRDLWLELERLETEAWHLAGEDRPLVNQQSRQIPAVDRIGRVFHEPWYLDETETILASPKAQRPVGEMMSPALGSRLSATDVRRAVFRVYDPLAHRLVNTLAPKEPDGGNRPRIPLMEAEPLKIVTESGENTRKRIFTVWWPREEPLPHPSAMSPLPPSVLRAMAARISGADGEDVYLDAPDLEDIEVISFGNGFAVVNEDGAFLVESGRGRRSRIDAAADLVKRQAILATELDAIQADIAKRASQLADDLRKRGNTRAAIRRQRHCAAINARLIELRGKLDVPLESDDAGLTNLKDTLARLWNTRARLGELIAEVEAFDRSSRTAEELRLFMVGRIAAAVALGFIASGGLVGPLTAALNWEETLCAWEPLAIFGSVFTLTITLAWIMESCFRQSVGK